jgi:hypothetical protein
MPLDVMELDRELFCAMILNFRCSINKKQFLELYERFSRIIIHHMPVYW